MQVIARVFALTLLAATSIAAAPPEARIVLKPMALDPAAGTASLDVTMTIPDLKGAAAETLFAQQAGAPGMTHGVVLADMTMRDGAGPVTLSGERGAWKADRAVAGTTVIHYQAKIDNATGGILSSIPHVDGPGLFGIGQMLFAIPKTETPYRIAIHWDLSGLASGVKGISSFGDGDVTLPAGKFSRLTYAMFMAGDIKRVPDAPKGGFSANWTGTPQFDIHAAMAWTRQLYSYMSRFFADPAEPLYYIFLHETSTATGNGVAAPHAFSYGYGPNTTVEGTKGILGHEMTHTWTTNDLGKWYTEGDAVYYQTLLPWRAGLIPTKNRLRDINLTAARYFTNGAIHAPDADIVPRFWTDQRYNVLGYDRGAIYFAVLNGKIRHKSGGKRSVDDLVRVMVALARDEKPVTEEIWVDLLRKELGEEGPAFHRAMMTGTTLVPESDDYGPCFRRVNARIRLFDLGFGTEVLTRRTVVEGLRPGSEAEKAGLREGDKVDYRISTEGALRDPEMPVTMKVTRDGKTFPITYLPRGTAIDAYQWERVPNVPESQCR